jgi:hypothetical protein
LAAVGRGGFFYLLGFDNGDTIFAIFLGEFPAI